MQPRRKPYPRRMRIEFPGMNREDCGQPRAIDRVDRTEDAARRAHPQAPSPAHRHYVPKPIRHQWRYFSYRSGVSVSDMRIARISHRTDELDGRHARVDAHALASEHIEGPQRPVVDRPFRRTEHRRAWSALADDEVGNRVDRSEHFHPGLLVANRDAEAALDLEHELQHVDGIEPEAFAEQRRRITYVFRRDRQPEAAHDRLLDLGLELVLSCSHMSKRARASGERRITRGRRRRR